MRMKTRIELGPQQRVQMQVREKYKKRKEEDA